MSTIGRILDRLLPRRIEKRRIERGRRMLKFQLPKTENTSLKASVLEYCIRKLHTTVFIETGTYQGATTSLAAKHFAEVHTIELSGELHRAAQERFRARKNISCHQGDSGEVMPRVLNGLKERSVFFWLDGHYSGTGTARAESNTPILEEIAAIRASGLTRWMILVDDLRIFGAKPTRSETDLSLTGYPTVAEVVAAIRALDSKAEFGVWGDTLVAMASSFERPLDETSVNLLASRVCDPAVRDDDGALASALKAEKSLMKSPPEVAKALDQLARGFPQSEKWNLAGHYHLWAGLAALGAKQFDRAAQDFRRALELDAAHWRVSCYLAQALLGAGRRLEAWAVVSPMENFAAGRALLKDTLESVLHKRAEKEFSDAGEAKILKLAGKLLPKSPLLFDVGAHVGDWTAEALRILPQGAVHCFEPGPQAQALLSRRLASETACGRILLNNVAVGSECGAAPWHAHGHSTASAPVHPRPDEAIVRATGEAAPMMVPMLSLDDYCEGRSIRRIHLLHISAAGSGLAAIHGASRMLARGDVDLLQFAHGGAGQDAGVRLADVAALLGGYGMPLFRITPEGPRPLEINQQSPGDFQCARFLAVHPRLAGHVTGKPDDRGWRRHFESLHTPPVGVVHVGAHEGKEQSIYEELGFQRMLYVEANPAVFEKLKKNVESRPGVKLFCGAASDQNSTLELRITSMDQSSSLLPLKKHLEIYPDIREVGRVSVRALRLDDIMRECGEPPEGCTLLNIDVQGAELQVLRGAESLLNHVAALNVEVNFEELYEGAPLLEELDAELESRGFQRIAVDTPFHPLWGDAFYARRGAISMTSLGSNGRLGNQFFQYAFLKLHGRIHNLTVQTPDWPGRVLFQAGDARCREVAWPQIRDLATRAGESVLLTTDPCPRNVDLWGYFQFHTSFYRPHRDFIRSLFRPAPHLASLVGPKLTGLRARGNTLVAIHIRRGDYGSRQFFRAPVAWYRSWLSALWSTLDKPVLYIASDEPGPLKTELAGFNPVFAEDLGECALPEDADCLLDFLVLAHADALAISNSSFSFAAAMLNRGTAIFARPSLPSRCLIPFDPWNSAVLLPEKIEDYPADWLNDEPATRCLHPPV